jgi:hypothetical protein
MLCADVNDMLYEYIYGELDEIKTREIKKHLNECDECRSEYEKLKVLLIDDMEDFVKAAEVIKAPENLQKKIESKVNFNLWRMLPRVVTAACLAIFLFYSVPVAGYYIVQNSPLDKYIDFENRIEKEYEEGIGQLVEKSSTMKEITFTVDAVIRKEDKTIILYTVKVPPGEDINYAMPESSSITIEDQFGMTYDRRSGVTTLRNANEDGETMAILEIEPLYFWSYKLKLRITGMETGFLVPLEEPEKKTHYQIEKHKDVYGKWEVEFFINKSGKKKQR